MIHTDNIIPKKDHSLFERKLQKTRGYEHI